MSEQAYRLARLLAPGLVQRCGRHVAAAQRATGHFAVLPDEAEHSPLGESDAEVFAADPAPPGRSSSLHARYPQYEIGRWTYGDLRVDSWDDGATLRVGAFCSIARGVRVVLGGEHRSDWVTTFPFYALWESARHISSDPSTKGDVVIGNDVWIGTEALIVSGVTIGDGAVIGARSLVAKDVEPYSIVAGNPARLVRRRCSEHLVQRLLQLRWWDWDDEVIAQLVPWLLSPDVEEFVREAERLRTAG